MVTTHAQSMKIYFWVDDCNYSSIACMQPVVFHSILSTITRRFLLHMVGEKGLVLTDIPDEPRHVECLAGIGHLEAWRLPQLL